MGSSSSSSSSHEAPQKITIVVAPVELTAIHTDSKGYHQHLERLAESFGVPLPALFTTGCVKLFRGDEIAVQVRDASVDARIQ